MSRDAQRRSFAPVCHAGWRRAVIWCLATLGPGLLLSCGVWFGCLWLLQCALAEAQQDMRLALAKHSELGQRFGWTDYLPDVVFYPVVTEAVLKGDESAAMKHIPLRLLEARAFGGFARLKKAGGSLDEDSEPVPGAARWVRRLPRGLLEDLYATERHAFPRPVARRLTEEPHKAIPEEMLEAIHKAIITKVSEPRGVLMVGGGDLIRVVDPDYPSLHPDVTAQEYEAAVNRLRAYEQYCRWDQTYARLVGMAAGDGVH
ncbi:MAG TPA: hypothetical protein PK280_15470 [Planctomycetota bacterium]|nr:hypothetical protein [Planctomycetota bacterium]